MPSSAATFDEVVSLLCRLHRVKDRAYGDAWRRRGEVLGIFANLARKHDRLELALKETTTSKAESLADTVADLCIYAGKYVTWLAEVAPLEHDALGDGAGAWAISRGREGLEEALRGLQTWAWRARVASPQTVPAAAACVAAAFSELEEALLRQADGMKSGLSTAQKVDRAMRLATCSVWLLVRLDEGDHSLIEGFRASVDNMDRT